MSSASKAFKIDWLKGKARRSPDLGCDLHLPQVRCSVCGETWGSVYAYPGFNFDFLNPKEFNWERTLSTEEFQRQIRERIQRSVGRSVMVVPGAGVGPLTGTSAFAKFDDDFVWGTILCPQISKVAEKILASEGVQLLTADVSMRCRGRLVESLFAIQAEPASLLTAESLHKHRIKHCVNCDKYTAPLPTERVIVPEGYEIRKSAWPKGQHLVTLAETLDILASSEFMAAVQKHNLTGIAFEECGVYVEESALGVASGIDHPPKRKVEPAKGSPEYEENRAPVQTIIKRVTKSTDRDAAYESASQVAAILKLNLIHKEKLIIGDEFYPYQVALHTKEFHCTVGISDKKFGIRATHRRDTRGIPKGATFCVNFREPLAHMFCKQKVEDISRALEVDVFTQPWSDLTTASSVLLSESVLDCFARLDLAAAAEFFLSPVQLSVDFPFVSPQHCAEQAGILRDLITNVHAEAVKFSKAQRKHRK